MIRYKNRYTNTLRNILSPLALLLAIFLSVPTFAQGQGIISGIVVDGETGEELIAVNIIVTGTQIGAASDLNGEFRLTNVPAGTHSLEVSYIGYTKQTVKGIEVKSGEVSKLEIAMMPDVLELEEVIVEARALRNTEASLLKERQKSNSVSDAISSEAISRSGSSDAAAAVSRVTGASVVGGKYVYVRGLGDRYSSTHLNGAELPSADPDKKAFNLDLFPASLLDNIVTLKTFTPDKPGNFTGGIVDVGTKAFPEQFNFNVSVSGSYNTLTTGNESYITYGGGGNDWLGMDDGSRDIPAILADPNVEVPSPIEARRDDELAQQLDDMSNAFTPVMSPSSGSAPLNNSFSLSVGDQEDVLGNPFGYQASLSYSRNFKFYDDGIIGRWQLRGNASEQDLLSSDMDLNDIKSTEEASWGGLVTLSYRLAQNHQLSFNTIYSQSGEASSRYQYGSWTDQLSEDFVYETRTLLYTERNLQSYQLTGKHVFPALNETEIEWKGAFATNEQLEPDLRFFSDDYVEEDGNRLYNIQNNLYNYPTRFFRNLNEDNTNLDLKVSVPFQQWSGQKAQLKFGGSFIQKDREFNERRFEYQQNDPRAQFTGDFDYFFNELVGIYDSSRNTFGYHISDESRTSSNYTGDETITAGFFMVELPILSNLRFVGGARLETTDIEVLSADTSQQAGILDESDLLPSVNFIYQFNQNTNLRMAYGRTLARPNFRELAPYRTFEFLGDYLFAGNANLKRTLIDNFDVRLEWFLNPGEILAVSGFYKEFENPIERTIDIETNNISYKNVDQGKVYGIELEARKNLYQVWEELKFFQVAANFSLVRSVVDIPANELELIQRFDESAETTRPLFGQSPYILNFELSYINPDMGTTAGLFLNTFGDRLSEVTLGATPDVFESGRTTVDIIVSQEIFGGLKGKFSAKNLLDAEFKRIVEFKDTEYVYNGYGLGQTFSLGFSYSI